jgi:hypothetical protein
MESSMEIPQKSKARTAICSNDTSLGHIPEGM